MNVITFFIFVMLFFYQTGMVILSAVTSIAAKALKPHYVSLLNLLTIALSDSVNTEVSYLSIKLVIFIIVMHVKFTFV